MKTNHKKLVIGGDVGNAGFGCYYRISIGDKIGLVITNIDAGSDATIKDINLKWLRIGN